MSNPTGNTPSPKPQPTGGAGDAEEKKKKEELATSAAEAMRQALKQLLKGLGSLFSGMVKGAKAVGSLFKGKKKETKDESGAEGNTEGKNNKNKESEQENAKGSKSFLELLKEMAKMFDWRSKKKGSYDLPPAPAAPAAAKPSAPTAAPATPAPPQIMAAQAAVKATQAAPQQTAASAAAKPAVAALSFNMMDELKNRLSQQNFGLKSVDKNGGVPNTSGAKEKNPGPPYNITTAAPSPLSTKPTPGDKKKEEPAAPASTAPKGPGR